MSLIREYFTQILHIRVENMPRHVRDAFPHSILRKILQKGPLHETPNSNSIRAEATRRIIEERTSRKPSGGIRAASETHLRAIWGGLVDKSSG